MPSRKQVEVLVMNDGNAAAGGVLATSTASTATAEKKAKPAADKKPKITPATNKKTPAVKSNKSQMTLSSFFGGGTKPKSPSSPAMKGGTNSKKPNNSNEVTAKTKSTTGSLAKATSSSKKQTAGRVTPHTLSSETTSASKAPDSVAELRRKSDLLEIVVGRLQPTPNIDAVVMPMDVVEQSPENSNNGNCMDDDSLLPTIPSVKSCRMRPPLTAAKRAHSDTHCSPEDSIDAMSQQKSPPRDGMSQESAAATQDSTVSDKKQSSEGPGYKRLRSQLVEKFEEDLANNSLNNHLTASEAPEDVIDDASLKGKTMMGAATEQFDDTNAGDAMEIDNSTSRSGLDDVPMNVDVEGAAEVQKGIARRTEQEQNGAADNNDNVINLCDSSQGSCPGNEEAETTGRKPRVSSATEDAVASTKVDPEADSTEQTQSDKTTEDAGISQPASKPETAKNGEKFVASAACQGARELDPDSQTQLEKYEAMRVKHCEIASALVNHANQGLEDEAIDIVMPPVNSMENVVDGPEFPDAAVPHLASMVEGSRLPLSLLANQACKMLNDAFGQSDGGSGSCFSLDCVSGKIKLLATRKAYVKNPAVASGLVVSNTVSSDTDIFDDQNNDRMWRWEVISLEILPDGSASKVKKARAARKKLSSHFNATAKLLGTLDECIKILKEGKWSSTMQRLEKLRGRLTQEEEKVLKFERDAEKARLVEDAKKKKLASTNQKTREDKEKEKERKKKEADERNLEKEKEKERKKKEAEEKRLEKEREKERKKQEAEEAKRKKAFEKEEKERKEKEQAELQRSKQEKAMLSFFRPVKTASAKKEPPSKPVEYAAPRREGRQPETQSGFDSERFRSCIESVETHATGPYFKSLSSRAIASRARKTRKVSVTVFVTSQIQAPDPFGPPTFDEEKVIQVPNKYKFLRFSEDLRPPYHGTWSKKSKIVTGKNPFGKDTTHLDYDNDSEAEWEEGDDDPGVDVDDDDGDEEEENMIDEEGDPLKYNYQDGWLAEDDDLGEEDVDEETLKMRKHKLEEANRRDASRGVVPVCIVAPAQSGLPITEAFSSPDDPNLKRRVEGFSSKDAHKLVSDHYNEQLADMDVFLDAFPPSLVDENEGELGEANASAPAKSLAQEPSNDDLKVIARFLHHKNFKSKEQAVEELRITHPNVTASRAQAQRSLDTIAEKKRNSKVKNCVYWEVKQSVLEELGLDDLQKMTLPADEAEAPKEEKAEKPTMKKAKSKPSPKESVTSQPSSGSKKRKPEAPAGSALVLAAFLKKKKL